MGISSGGNCKWQNAFCLLSLAAPVHRPHTGKIFQFPSVDMKGLIARRFVKGRTQGDDKDVSD